RAPRPPTPPGFPQPFPRFLGILGEGAGRALSLCGGAGAAGCRDRSAQHVPAAPPRRAIAHATPSAVTRAAPPPCLRTGPRSPPCTVGRARRAALPALASSRKS